MTPAVSTTMRASGCWDGRAAGFTEGPGACPGLSGFGETERALLGSGERAMQRRRQLAGALWAMAAFTLLPAVVPVLASPPRPAPKSAPPSGRPVPAKAAPPGAKPASNAGALP